MFSAKKLKKNFENGIKINFASLIKCRRNRRWNVIYIFAHVNPLGHIQAEWHVNKTCVCVMNIANNNGYGLSRNMKI